MMVSDSEDDDDTVDTASDDDDTVLDAEDSNKSSQSPPSEPLATRFDLDGPTQTGQAPPAIVEEEEDRQLTNAAAQLLQFHHKFGHVSFKRLQQMAKLGIIPKRMASCPVPACSACLYA